MNRLIFTAILSLIALPSLAMPPQDTGNAQGHSGQESPYKQQRKNPANVMKEVLSLRDEQIEAVTEVMQSERKAMHELRRQNHQGQREQHDALHQQTIDKLSKILDAQQLVQFEAFTKGMRAARQQNKKRSDGQNGASRDSRTQY